MCDLEGGCLAVDGELIEEQHVLYRPKRLAGEFLVHVQYSLSYLDRHLYWVISRDFQRRLFPWTPGQDYNEHAPEPAVRPLTIGCLPLPSSICDIVSVRGQSKLDWIDSTRVCGKVVDYFDPAFPSMVGKTVISPQIRRNPTNQPECISQSTPRTATHQHRDRYDMTRHSPHQPITSKSSIRGTRGNSLPNDVLLSMA